MNTSPGPRPVLRRALLVRAGRSATDVDRSRTPWALLHRWPAVLAAAAALLGTACGTAPTGSMPSEPVIELLPLASGAGGRLVVLDMEGEAALDTDEVQVPKPAAPRVPASVVSARRSAKDTPDDAVTLQWRDAWLMGLRIELPQALDLRSFRDEGTLEFDLRVDDMARGGLHVAFTCGLHCGRKLNFVLPSRDLQGRGWQRVSFPLRCFVREGDDWRAVRQPVTIDGSGTGRASVARLQLRRQGTANQGCTDVRTESVTPVPLNQVWSLEWWMPRHAQKLAEIQRRRLAGEPTGVVFIGDSITHGWEDVGKAVWERHFARYGALGLGYGGDKTENVLWRLQHGELDGISPRAVVLMIGTNNTGDRLEDPRTVAAGVERILAEIHQRQPQAHVLLLAIFPRDEKPDSLLRRHNARINERLARLARPGDSGRVVFLDIGASLTNPDGTLSRDVMPDLLHLSEQGYERWARAIEAPLAALMQR